MTDGKRPAMVTRAYSRFTVKTVDEEQRIIEGIATTPSTDRMGDIVEPLGAEYILPIPFLWQHDSAQPIGQVTSAKASSTGISVTVQIAKIDEPGTLKDRIDEAWQSIKAGLVRGMSIGFSPVEYSIIEETYGYRFIKWLWLELSAVTIPANADASISAIKRLDTRAAIGTKRAPVLLMHSTPGASGTNTTAKRGPVQLIPRKP